MALGWKHSPWDGALGFQDGGGGALQSLLLSSQGSL